MKKLVLLLAAALFLSVFGGCSALAQGHSFSEKGKLHVAASFYPMFDFAKKIGGEHVEIVTMVPSGTEPHDWEPATSDMALLETADVFIYNGAGMEYWAKDMLTSVKSKKFKTVEASKGISILSGEGTEGKDSEDPHVWLNPQNAKAELLNIEKAFAEADAQNTAYYEANYNKYAAKLDALDAEYKQTLSACVKKDVVVAHQAFGYLCAAYGLKQVPIEGLMADSEPDPQRMTEIIDFIKKNNVKTIFSEELLSPKVANSIAKETGATVEVLNPLEGLSDADIKAGGDYISVMEKNLVKLKAALQ